MSFCSVITRQVDRNRMTLSFMKSGRSYKKYSLIYLKTNSISKRKHLSTTTIKDFLFPNKGEKGFSDIHVAHFPDVHTFFLSQKPLRICGSTFFNIFTESAPLGGFSHRVHMSICLFMCLFAPSGAFFFKAFHWP